MEQPHGKVFLQGHQPQLDSPPAITDDSFNPDTAVTYIQDEFD